MSRKLKIFHIADLQIEIRVSGQNGQRYEEYRSVLIKTLDAVKNEQPQIVAIVGDIFEFEQTTADEQTMFGWFLRELTNVDSVRRIVITDGNHDVKQKVNGLIVSGTKQNTITAIENVVRLINNPKIKYFKHSGVYKDDYYELSWAVWSQLDKWSVKEPKPNYSPWVDNDVPNTPFIELYHDPIKGCVGFDNKSNHNNYVVTLDSFKANTVLCGDIHAPSIQWHSNGKLFTYPSSLIMRNFGEGDYITNFNLTQLGNQRHGYNIVIYDLDTDKAESCEFHRIVNDVSRTTIYFDETYNYTEQELKITCDSINKSTINDVRVVCKSGVKKFVENQQLISETFYKLIPNCRLFFDYETDSVEFDDVDLEMFNDIEQVIDKDKILEISKKYINNIVSKTTTIADDDKEQTENYIYELLVKALQISDLSKKQQKIDLISFEVENFMKLGKTEFVFTPNGVTIIQGGNRVGKTTLKHLINFVWNDQILFHQNMRDKKYNYAQYFNTDLKDEDVVLIKHKALINSEPITITKRLERVWKAKKRDVSVEDWIDNVKEINVKLIVETPNETFEDKLAFEYLENIINFEQMQRICFVTQDTISNLTRTSTQDLAQNFLEVMGLNISEPLEDGFETLKQNEMVSISKPSQSVEDIVKFIENKEIEIANKELEFKQKQQSHDDLVLKNSALEKTISDKRNQLHQVQTPFEIQRDIDNNIKIKQQKQSEIGAKQVEIDKLLNDGDSLNKIQNDILALESLILTHKTDKVNLSNSILELKNKELSVNGSLTEFVTNQQKILQSDLDSITSRIESENQSILQYTQQSVTTNQQIEQRKNIERNEINQYINTFTSDRENKLRIKQSLEYELITQNNEISKLQATKQRLEFDVQKLIESLECNCNTCGQLLQGDAKRVVEDEINKSKNEILSINFDEIITKQKQLETQISETQSEINVLNDKILEQQNLLRLVDNKVYDDLNKIISDIQNNIDCCNQTIIDFRNESERLKSEFVGEMKQNSVYIGYKNELDVIKTEIQNIETNITQKDIIIKQNENELVELKHKIEIFNSKQDLLKRLNDDINELNKTINNIDGINSVLNKNILLAFENEKTTKEVIEPLVLEHTKLQNELNVLSNEITNMLNTNINQTNELEFLKRDLVNAKKYKLVEASFKLYKKLIGKNGLPQYIFAHLVPLINTQINSILSDVDFKLVFSQETLELRFFDIKKQISRPIQFCSGMESTTIGLSITNIMRILNHSKRFNFLFIDEISGTLNSGEHITEYEAKNNQEVVRGFIEKISDNVPIYIVDHILQFRNSRIVNVIPTENGSIYK